VFACSIHCLALPWSCLSIRQRLCASNYLWLQKWLWRPKSDAHTVADATAQTT